MQNDFESPIESTTSGYHMTFKNGWTVSVQWGKGSYSSNYMQKSSVTTCAEIWAFFGDLRHPFTTNPEGYLSPDEIADYIHEVKGQPNHWTMRGTPSCSRGAEGCSC